MGSSSGGSVNYNESGYEKNKNIESLCRRCQKEMLKRRNKQLLSSNFFLPQLFNKQC